MLLSRAFLLWRQVFAPALLALALLPAAAAQPQLVAQNAETRAAQALEHARQQGPLALYAFFQDMPKGADLHTHLAGAVYAESFIREAAEDNLCVNSKTLVLYKTMAMTRSLPPQPVCGEEGERVANALTNQKLYDQLINVFSMRTFVPTAGESGHDHFFNSFDHFLAVEDPKHVGDWVDELASRAAAQNEQYLEIMNTPNFRPAVAALAENLGPIDMQTDFAHLRQQLLDAGLAKFLPDQRAEFDEGERRRRELEHCSQNGGAPACNLQVRFLYQVLRALPSQAVFVQLVCGFELASTDPLIVGINMVQPEDGRMSMENYRLQMQMVQALHALYPKVHITLHAGEIAPGMVTPDGLRFHIRSAVEDAHAERIGHGVDVMYEDHPYDLLREMATKRVMAEINLTSNDVILNIKGLDHPLPMYRIYHVPVALSTDDEGVSRINMTHEYVRAATTYPLTYGDFKQMVRTGIEHSFLPGDSLWEQTGPWEGYGHPHAACRTQLGREQASGACASLLQASEKARQEFELERRFHVFEGSF
jgi:adenosine deaminase